MQDLVQKGCEVDEDAERTGGEHQANGVAHEDHRSRDLAAGFVMGLCQGLHLMVSPVAQRINNAEDVVKQGNEEEDGP